MTRRELRRNQKRLEQVKRDRATVDAGGRGYGRPMLSRFAGVCPDCGEAIEKGAEIVYYRVTREALHSNCVTKEA